MQDIYQQRPRRQRAENSGCDGDVYIEVKASYLLKVSLRKAHTSGLYGRDKRTFTIYPPFPTNFPPEFATPMETKLNADYAEFFLQFHGLLGVCTVSVKSSCRNNDDG